MKKNMKKKKKKKKRFVLERFFRVLYIYQNQNSIKDEETKINKIKGIIFLCLTISFYLL